MRAALGPRILPALVTLALGALAFLPICDLHFDCGCRWPGLGGHSHCDVLTSGPPDCPWCHHAWTGYAAMAFSAGAGLAPILALRRGTHWAVATLAGSTTFLLAALLAGILTSLVLGRPPLAGL